jgi:predicted PurR-regulated permease PerM
MTMLQSPRVSEPRQTARAFVLLVAGLVLVGLAPLGVGLLGAIVLYEVCAPSYGWLARRVGPRLAAALTVVIVMALVATPAIWLTGHLAVRLPLVRIALASRRLQGAEGPAAGMLAQFDTLAAHASSTAASWLPGELLSIGGSAAWALVNWSIALLGLYYLLGSAATGWRRFAGVLPFSPSGAEALRVRLRDTTRGMVAGTLLSAAAQGVAIGMGFWLAGLADVPFWSVVAAIATLVPVVGNILVWGPALLLMLLDGHYGGALSIGIFGGLLPPVISRVVMAGVSRRMSAVHPMITLVGVLAGIRVAGVAGLVLGPVALAMFFALVDTYTQEYAGESS